MTNFYQNHGLSKTHLYSIWNQLKNRCVRKNHPLYLKFGMQGIKMHTDWEEDFSVFYEWANQNGYKENLFLVRNGEKGDYSPENCFFSETAEKPVRKKRGMSPSERYHAKKASNPQETRLKNIWKSVKERCLKPYSKDYRFYGAKGIVICEEWAESFEAFKGWSLANGYKSQYILGRLNTEDGYSPENCQWTTIQKQNRERNSNIRIEVDGSEKTLYDLSDEFGINPATIRGRLERGLSGEDLTKPVGTIEVNGKVMSFKEAEQLTGIPSSTLMGRFYRGKTKQNDLLHPSRDYNRYSEVTINGKTYSLKEWSKITGIQYPTLVNRYKNGLRGDQLIEKTGTK